MKNVIPLLQTRFGTEEVDGTFVSDEEIRCVSPPHAEGDVIVEIRPTADGRFTSDKVKQSLRTLFLVYFPLV